MNAFRPVGDGHVHEVGDARGAAALPPATGARRALVVAAHSLAIFVEGAAEYQVDVNGRAFVVREGLARREVVVVAVDGARVPVAAGVVKLAVVRETGVGVGRNEAELDGGGAEVAAVIRGDLGELRPIGVDREVDDAASSRH